MSTVTVTDHLLRGLAPIPTTSWKEIDDEARERLTPMLAARRLADWVGPGGWRRSAMTDRAYHRARRAAGRYLGRGGAGPAAPGAADGRVPGPVHGETARDRGHPARGLDVGQDLSIGYRHHDADTVYLYLEESFAFRVVEPDAVVALS